MTLPMIPPENGALICGKIRRSIFGNDGSRNYELKLRADVNGPYYELCCQLDSGTWLCDQERFRTWGDVSGFFYRLRLEDIEWLYY